MGNKKLLIGVGLLLTSIIMIPHHAKATSDFGTISIANPDNPLEGITIMDRNLGATSNDIRNTNSYGYKYQWGNNYGFINGCFTDKSNGCSDSVTTSAKGISDREQYQYRNGFPRDEIYNNSGYYESTFYKLDISPWYHWGRGNHHDGLWGGSNDNDSNSRGEKEKNPEDRKGPCPIGYHIPSAGEWGLLVEYWRNTYEKDITNYGNGYYYSDSSAFRDYFKIPYAGYRGYNDAILYQQGSLGWYWSSSPYGIMEEYLNNDAEGLGYIGEYARYFSIAPNFVGSDGGNNRHTGYPIRCFKNTYSPESIEVVPTNCKKIKNIEISHTISGNIITLNLDEIAGENIEVSIYNPNEDLYRKLGNVNSSNGKFIYKAKWEGEQKFLLSNECDSIFYKLDISTIECEGIENANISHILNNDIITLRWDPIAGDNIKISIYDPKIEAIKDLGVVNMYDRSFNYKAKWEGEQKFLLSNGCSYVYYLADVKKLTEQEKKHTNEMDEAYQFAYRNGITTTNNINKAKMNSSLTRIAMAKMLSNYAINVLGKIPDTSKGTPVFNDVTYKQNFDYGNAVTLSFQLGIMGQNMKNNNFRPNDEVTRAEFATALSRMLYNTEDGKGNVKYYEPHIAKLYSEGIINNTNAKMKEKRGYVMIMLMRTAE